MKQFFRRSAAKVATLMLASLMLTIVAFAQKRITGKVVGSDGKPVAGATIQVKGSNTGTSTLEDGSFSITVPQNATLQISATGTKSQDVKVGSLSEINVTLATTLSNLEEVVVTGYTAQRKKDITGAVAVVNVKDMTANPGSNIENLLQGRASGVTVTSSGVPGAGSNIRIRGFSTFGSNDPLFVVDGIQLSSVADINPSDIETMQVLKDASASALYGSAAANGVIIITTKRGKVGAPKISYEGYYGSQYFNKGLDLLNTKEYGDYLWKLAINAGQVDAQGRVRHGQYGPGDGLTSPKIPDYILAGSKSGAYEGDPAANPNLYKLDLYNVNDDSKTYLIHRANKVGTDWLKEITQTAPMTNHQVNVSGGTDKGNYLFGLNYFDQAGLVIKTKYKRYSLRSNTNFVIKNKVRVGEALQINFIDQIPGFVNQDESNAILMAARMQPIVPVYDIKGNWAGTRGSNLGNAGNPVADRHRDADKKDTKIGVIGNLYAEVDFLKYFTARSNFGIDWGTNASSGFGLPRYETSEGRGGTGSYYENMSNGYALTWFNTVRFKKTFADLHDVSVILGNEVKQFRGRGTGASSSDYFLFDRNFWQVSSGQNPTPSGYSYEYLSRFYTPILLKADYTFNNKYIFSGSFRRDGASNEFGPVNKYGNFGGASFGWRMSDESFMKSTASWLNDLKVRIGYGVLGNNRIPGFGFANLYAFENGFTTYPINGGNSATAGFAHRKIGNPDVQWEVAGTTNFGIDASMLDNKLNVTLEVYQKKTSKLLFPVELDPTIYGFVDNQPRNIGKMTNNGIDLSVNYRGKSGKDFSYEVGMNLSAYRNTVDAIAGDFVDGSRTRIDPFNRSVVGQPFMSFYGYQLDGFFDTPAELATLQQGGSFVGGWKYKDISGANGKPDGKIDEKDKTFIGNPHPLFIAGINLSATYKAWDFTAFIYWKAGGDLANYVRYWTDFNTFQGNRTRRVLYDSWEKPGDEKLLPRLNGGDGASGQVPVSYYIEPGGYLRLKNLSVGYNVASRNIKKIGLDRLRLYFQAQNIITITKYSGLDPEIGNFNTGRGDYRNQAVDYNMGVDGGNFPVPRIVSFGVNASF
jgi:TonB-linked SusC/RagA family outer membrane protein